VRAGADLVMGNRFRGGIAPGAMPPLHRYLGNPVLSTVGQVFTGAPIKDFHCGLRAFRRDSILALNLQAPGMEFASEMVVLASYNGLDIREVPTTLSPDGRSRPPHLRSWRDGWRHLRFLLTFAPDWLFFYPGLILVTAGLVAFSTLLGSNLYLGEIVLGIHTMLFASAGVLIGGQLLSFWYLARLFGVREGYWRSSPGFDRARRILSVDFCSLSGGMLLLLGFGLALAAFLGWARASFGPLDGLTGTSRLVIGAVLCAAAGTQLAMTGFLAFLMSDRR